MEYTKSLIKKLKANKNIENAEKMKSYMRNKFDFFGIKSTTRRKLSREFLLKKNLPKKTDLFPVIEDLWNQPQRELQYIALDLLIKFSKNPEENFIDLYEKLIITKSWWDTVDLTASKLVGSYFKKFPEKIRAYNEKWLKSDNIWLQRVSLLFQLKYKEKTDTKLLKYNILHLSHTDEFFIDKAIGWILREYSKTNKEFVIDFVKEQKLSKLSNREALKWLKNKKLI